MPSAVKTALNHHTVIVIGRRHQLITFMPLTKDSIAGGKHKAQNVPDCHINRLANRRLEVIFHQTVNSADAGQKARFPGAKG